MVKLIQEAVTGSEQVPSNSDPMSALAEFYRALNSRDIALMQQNWINSEEAAMDNPLGGIRRGWIEIRSVYEKLFRADASYHFEFYDYTLHQFHDIFYVVGRERGYVKKDETLDMRIRTTRIFRFVGERWRQVHHHGSIEDPNLLAAYQALVR